MLLTLRRDRTGRRGTSRHSRLRQDTAARNVRPIGRLFACCVASCEMGLRWMCCVAALLRTELRCPWTTIRLEREHLAHRWRRADRSEALHSTDRMWTFTSVPAASLAQAGMQRLRRGADLMHDTAQVVEALVADYDQPHALRRVPNRECSLWWHAVPHRAVFVTE